MAQLAVLHLWERYWVDLLQLVCLWFILQFFPNNFFNSALTEDLVPLVSIHFWLHSSSFPSACDANILALCFSSNIFPDDLELLEDLDDFDELGDFKLSLDFRDLAGRVILGYYPLIWNYTGF